MPQENASRRGRADMMPSTIDLAALAILDTASQAISAKARAEAIEAYRAEAAAADQKARKYAKAMAPGVRRANLLAPPETGGNHRINPSLQYVCEFLSPIREWVECGIVWDEDEDDAGRVRYLAAVQEVWLAGVNIFPLLDADAQSDLEQAIELADAHEAAAYVREPY